jgi:hypothetical protein
MISTQHQQIGFYNRDIKSKVHSIDWPQRPRGLVGVFFYSNLGTIWGGWPTPRSSRCIPRKETLYPLHRRLGAPQESAKTGGENFATTGIGSPDRPARSESLFRLRYSGPSVWFCVRCKLSLGIKCRTILAFIGLTELSHVLRLNILVWYKTNAFPNRVSRKQPFLKLGLRWVTQSISKY